MHPIKHTGMALLLFSQVSAAAVAELDMESSASVRAAGGVPVGKVTFVAGHRGRTAHFAAGAHVRLKPGPALTAKQGAIDMWVKPEWDGADQGRHTFWHMGGGQQHVTLFATGGKLLFVYKANAKAWHATTANIADWRRGTWHRLRATWKPAQDGKLACLLDVDRKWSSTSGAVPLDELPGELYIGARIQREPANAAIDQVRVSSEFTPPSLPSPKATTVAMRIDSTRPIGPMPRTWSFVTPWNSST